MCRLTSVHLTRNTPPWICQLWPTFRTKTWGTMLNLLLITLTSATAVQKLVLTDEWWVGKQAHLTRRVSEIPTLCTLELHLCHIPRTLRRKLCSDAAFNYTQISDLRIYMDSSFRETQSVVQFPLPPYTDVIPHSIWYRSLPYTRRVVLETMSTAQSRAAISR
jgi:hypothetical protein